MPIDPIKIPQNVYIEDRIVGPLTLKQVIICAIGGGFSYAMFASMSKTYGSVALPIQILVWLPAAVSIAFAFVRINDLSLMRICFLLMEKMNKPATRTWTPRRGIIINVRTFHTAAEDKAKASTSLNPKKEQNFEELSTILDQQRIEKTQQIQKKTEEVENETFGDFMNDEPPDEREVLLDVEQNPNMRRPVNPERIIASPSAGIPLDGLAPKNGSVSLFQSPSPAH